MGRRPAPRQTGLVSCRLARMRQHKGLFIAVLLAGGAQAEPVGMFTDVKDVGVVSRATKRRSN